MPPSIIPLPDSAELRYWAATDNAAIPAISLNTLITGMPPPLSGAGGTGMFPGGPTAAGGATATHDPTRSIYVVVPYTNDITKKTQFYKKAPQGSFNPLWDLAVKHQYGYGNLLMDNTSIQV